MGDLGGYPAKMCDVSSTFEGDPHLHSTKLLSGLHIRCSDGQLGHFEDFVIDDENCAWPLWWSLPAIGGLASVWWSIRCW